VRNTLLCILALAVGFATAGVLISRHLQARHAAELARMQSQWSAERQDLEDALSRARADRNRFANVEPSSSSPLPTKEMGPTPEEIVALLVKLASDPSVKSQSGQRQVVYWLEELVRAGPTALPAIRDFLGRYEDLELDTSVISGRAPRNRLPGDYLFPPSLRFGFFDAVRRIGGPEAQEILAAALSQTGRGIEVAYLTRLLQEMSPDVYHASAVAAAHALLLQADPQSSSPLDRHHRDYLYAVLEFCHDTSYASVAQTQLVAADGKVDVGAVRYLQEALGRQAVPIAAQTYQDSRLTNSAAKEPFARLALAFVGADPQANQFYTQAINDNSLTPNHRRNLIEDLNQDGFADTRNLTTADLPLIENRIKLIEQLAPQAMDDINAAAFQEAYKDLINMRAKITTTPPAKP
jgi:hypothetical protein